ncbi:MAG: ABC transporter ATP-binding protein [Candidatus Bathyarchaeota archaeon]|nr:MAG: ABC transporter ATP-binding protein [Candidatus Bathyarchaeota archaeon]
MVTVQLENIKKSFTEPVLKGLNLSVKSEEFMSLLGPSGCGKTTTLNIICGFLKPDEGNVYVNDVVVNNLAPHKRDIGLVFQNYALFPHMTVKGNLAFGLKLRKVNKKEIEKMVQEAMELIKLEGKEDRYPRELSGGQQQRVALARALIVKPQVLLLDEPLSNLDAKLRREMRIELRRIHKEVATTTIYVTHDQVEALSLSDRVAIMHNGEIEQIGSPTEIYQRPKTDFIADFMGEQNIISGKVASVAEKETVVSVGDLLIHIPDSSLEKGKEVHLAFRKENVRVNKKKLSNVNVFKAQVIYHAFVGKYVQYLLSLDNIRILADVQVDFATQIYKEGDHVFVELRSEDFWVLQ